MACHYRHHETSTSSSQGQYALNKEWPSHTMMSFLSVICLHSSSNALVILPLDSLGKNDYILKRCASLTHGDESCERSHFTNINMSQLFHGNRLFGI